MRLLLILLVMATIEVVLIAKVGNAIGFFNTFLVIIATSVIGSWQLKKQWRFVMSKLQTMQTEPSQALLESVVLMVSGICLVVPGFVTDTIGFLGLIPAVREHMVRFLSKHSAILSKRNVWQQRQQTESEQESPRSPRTIEGEFERKDGE